MKASHDELWWAYLDGELTPAESANLDQSLSHDDRGCLAAEMRLEADFAEMIGREVACPKKVWKRALIQVKKTRRFERRAARRFMRPVWVAASLSSRC